MNIRNLKTDEQQEIETKMVSMEIILSSSSMYSDIEIIHDHMEEIQRLIH